MPLSNMSGVQFRLRDQVGNASLEQTANASMSVVTALQSYPNGAQLLGLASAFVLLAEAARLPVSDVLGMAKNCMAEAQGRRPEFAAVSDYINKELI